MQRVTLEAQYPAGLENDEYVRQIDGYLPTCEVAFIDEIFKANSAILNALLTLLNERLFDNGNQRLRVPLLCLVSTSTDEPQCPVPGCLLFPDMREEASVCAAPPDGAALHRWEPQMSCRRARSWMHSLTDS